MTKQGSIGHGMPSEPSSSKPLRIICHVGSLREMHMRSELVAGCRRRTSSGWHIRGMRDGQCWSTSSTTWRRRRRQDSHAPAGSGLCCSRHPNPASCDGQPPLIRKEKEHRKVEDEDQVLKRQRLDIEARFDQANAAAQDFEAAWSDSHTKPLQRLLRTAQITRDSWVGVKELC